MATSTLDRSEKQKRLGLAAGAIATIAVFVFMLWSGEPAFGFHASVIVPALIFSLPVLIIVATGFIWPVFSGSLLTLGGVMWSALMGFTVFQSSTPWTNLLMVLMIGIPFITSGLLFILSYKSSLKEEQEYGKYDPGS